MTAAVGSVTFCVLGYALSTAIKYEDAAQPMVQAIMLPLYFISGVFVPNINLPSWLKHVAQVFPVEHLADGLHKAYAPNVRGVGIVWSDIGVLAVWLAIGLAVGSALQLAAEGGDRLAQGIRRTSLEPCSTTQSAPGRSDEVARLGAHTQALQCAPARRVEAEHPASAVVTDEELPPDIGDATALPVERNPAHDFGAARIDSAATTLPS